jgi:exopolysaccharide production protein ExoZ
MYTKKLKSNRIESIDFIRGLSIFGVFGVHLTQLIEIDSKFVAFLEFGKAGPFLFFIVSGYLVHSQYIKFKHIPKYNHYFLKKRLIKLVPLYWIFSIISFTFPIMKFNYLYQFDFKLADVIKYLSFTFVFFKQNIFMIQPGGWSIANEIIFYFLFFLFTFIKNKYLNKILFLVIMYPIIFNSFLIINDSHLASYITENDYLFYSFYNAFQYFISGILLSLYFNKMIDVKKWYFLLFIFIYLSMMIISYYANIKIFQNIALNFSLILFSYFIIRFNLKSKIIGFYGKLSYEIYLSHFLVLYVLRNFYEEPFASINSVLGYTFNSILFTSLISLILFKTKNFFESKYFARSNILGNTTI